jgi:hypothetical protein
MEAETKIRLLWKPEITYKNNIFRVHATKAYGGVEAIAPLILKLGTGRDECLD